MGEIKNSNKSRIRLVASPMCHFNISAERKHKMNLATDTSLVESFVFNLERM